jgi:cytochrome c
VIKFPTTAGLFAAVGMAAMLGIGIYYSVRPDGGSHVVGRPLAQVQVPPLAPVQREGRAAFEEYCAVCHGANAAGQQGVAPPLIHIIYEPNHHGDQAFLRAALQGVPAHHWPFGDMPPVEGITGQEIENIVAYIRALQRANGIM